MTDQVTVADDVDHAACSSAERHHDELAQLSMLA